MRTKIDWTKPIEVLVGDVWVASEIEKEIDCLFGDKVHRVRVGDSRGVIVNEYGDIKLETTSTILKDRVRNVEEKRAKIDWAKPIEINSGGVWCPARHLGRLARSEGPNVNLVECMTVPGHRTFLYFDEYGEVLGMDWEGVGPVRNKIEATKGEGGPGRIIVMDEASSIDPETAWAELVKGAPLKAAKKALLEWNDLENNLHYDFQVQANQINTMAEKLAEVIAALIGDEVESEVEVEVEGLARRADLVAPSEPADQAGRWETDMEHTARDMREGRFPERSERQRIDQRKEIS